MSRFEPYYDELFIRDVLFNFTEDFFAVRENGEIKGIATLKYTTNLDSTVCSLGLLIAQAGYEESLLTGIVEYSGGTCNRAMVKLKFNYLKRIVTLKQNLLKICRRMVL